jgi:hypothetical protein
MTNGSALFANCDAFLTELSAADEAVLTGGKKGSSSKSKSKSKSSKSGSGSGSSSGGYGGCYYGCGHRYC